MKSAASDGIRLISAVAVRAQMASLVEDFTRSHDLAVDAVFDLNPAVATRILDGEGFDVGMTNPRHVRDLIAAGRVAAETHEPFGRIPLALAASGVGEAGALVAPDDIRALLLGAGSIAYTGEGTSGRTFIEVASRLGIWDRIASRARPLGAGRPVAAAARGEVDLAVAPLTTVIAADGVGAVAILPPDLGADIEMSIFLSATTGRPAQATQLLRFLTDGARDPYLASTGLTRFRLA